MSKLNINFNDYKSSGVYFLEIDNSIIDSVVATSGRLAVGFSKKGPINTPVYIDNTADLLDVFGEPDAKLERRGVFFNRAGQTLIRRSPAYMLNLVPFNKVSKPGTTSGSTVMEWADYDKVGIVAVSTKPSEANEKMTVGYPELFDKSRFWKASTDYLNNGVYQAKDKKARNILNIANVGSKDVTVFVRKAEGLKGFNKTVSEWYGTKANIPYKWMRPSDYMSDYFVEIIIVEGDWTDEKLAVDTFWKNYFELIPDGAAAYQLDHTLPAQFASSISMGIKKDKISKFMKLSAVNVIGDYTGCILPDFIDGTGALQSIEPIVNQDTNKTGIMISVDVQALEDGEKNTVDFVGHTATAGSMCQMMGYDFAYDSSLVTDFSKDSSVLVEIDQNQIKFKKGFDSKNEVGDYIYETTMELYGKLYVGAMVGVVSDAGAGNDGDLVRITKKQIFPDDVRDYPYKAVFTATDVLDTSSTKIKVVPSISESYTVLRPVMLKGIDMDAKVEALFNGKTYNDSLGYSYYGDDAAIAQIYEVLEDKGVRRSLLNDDIINFRYVIDTMGHGLGEECGSKKYLSRLANAKQHCTAIISAPSMTEFSTTSLANYYDDTDEYKVLDTKYIPLGGNDNLIKLEGFSLPTEENGAKNAGVFGPYLRYRTNSKTILMPPAADVANAYIAKFDGADPYITVANTNGILGNSQIAGVEYQMDRYDQDELEPFGFNPILYRNGDVMIYGDRTAYQEVLSDYNYLHVREILNTIEIECKAILDGYVFRYNNAQTRSEILTRINPILQGMKDAGALYQYEIEMDENNNTNEVINRSFAIIDIGVWITKNMEKVVARITVNKLDE